MRFSGVSFVGAFALLGGVLCAQEPVPPTGTVVIQSGDATASAAMHEEARSAANATPDVTDVERAALTVLAYDLDARLTPASARMETRARVTVRNDGAKALKFVALEISSTLKWESVSVHGKKLAFSQHVIDTDADHTGQATEVVIPLMDELAVGAQVVLDTFYSGTIAESSVRLTRLGASSSVSGDTDWDAIAEDGTALRGFGNVLWYPVATPQLFLGDGPALFDAVNAARLKNEQVTIGLRLSVMYAGDAPAAAYFCGRRAALKALADDPNASIGSSTGVATAEFAHETIGFRVPSLFVVELPEQMRAPIPNAAGQAVPAGGASSSSMASSDISSSGGDVPAFVPNSAMLAIESDDDGAIKGAVGSAEAIAPMLQVWLGAEPLSALTMIDHEGQPFEDGPLLVAPLSAIGTSDAGTALTHSMTHAFVQTGQPWMDEGLAQFMALLWTEHEAGHEAMMAQMQDLLQPLAIAEPNITKDTAEDAVAGQPLVSASSEVFYRRKAAAVWAMLRSIVGDEALADALTSFRQRTPKAEDTPESVAVAFENVLEHAGKQNFANPIDLRWFFRDWVLHDRGLPDLSIVDVVPRELPMGQGHGSGYLVAVNIHNDGAAEVQVPVIVRTAGGNTILSQLRVAAFSTSTSRTVTETAPVEVQVNDGTAPEVRATIHKLTVKSTRTE